MHLPCRILHYCGPLVNTLNNMNIQATLNGLSRLCVCVYAYIHAYTYYVNVVLMCEIIKNKEQLKIGEGIGSSLETWHWLLSKWRGTGEGCSWLCEEEQLSAVCELDEWQQQLNCSHRCARGSNGGMKGTGPCPRSLSSSRVGPELAISSCRARVWVLT